MTVWQLARYLAVVCGPSPAVLAAGSAVLVYGIVLQSLDPASAAQAFALALLFQTFAAGSGFHPLARRGLLDPVLVGGFPRWRCAITHLLVSIAPGVLLWLGLLLARPGTAGPGPSPGVTPGALAALYYVSLATWCVSLRVPRYVPGVAWLFVTVWLVTSRDVLWLRALTIAAPASWHEGVAQSTTVLALPLLLLGPPRPLHPGLALVLLAAGCAAAVAGVAWVARVDVPLGE